MVSEAASVIFQRANFDELRTFYATKRLHFEQSSQYAYVWLWRGNGVKEGNEKGGEKESVKESAKREDWQDVEEVRGYVIG